MYDPHISGIIADILAQRNWSQARSAVDGATSLSRALAQALFGDSILIKSTFRSSGKSKDLTELDPVLVKKIESMFHHVLVAINNDFNLAI